MADLSGVESRLHWAKHHLDRLEAEIHVFFDLNKNPFTHYLDPTDNRWVYAVRPDWPSVPPHWGLIVGDYIHSARSSLDHLVWQLVLTNNGTPGKHTAFPVFSREKGWNDKVEHRPAKLGPGPLEGVSSTAFDRIKSLQPYKADKSNDFLVGLNGLWNADKHQAIHSSFGYTTGSAPEIRIGGAPAEISDVLFTRGPLQPNAEIIRFAILQTVKDASAEMKMHLNASVSVAFGQVGQNQASIGYLFNSLRWLHETVATFEDEFR